MFRQLLQSRGHQRIHGLDRIAQRQQRNRINVICIDCHLQIYILVSQGERGAVKPWRVGGLSRLSLMRGDRLRLLFRTEHDKKQCYKDDSQSDKDGSINDFFHPKHHNFRFRTHKKTSRYCLLQCMEKNVIYSQQLREVTGFT